VIYGRGLVLRHPGRYRSVSAYPLTTMCCWMRAERERKGSRWGRRHRVEELRSPGEDRSVGDRERADIGCNCIFSSVSGIEIGQSTLIAGTVTSEAAGIVGPLGDPMMDQGRIPKARHPGEDVWLGAGVIVLDGVRSEGARSSARAPWSHGKSPNIPSLSVFRRASSAPAEIEPGGSIVRGSG